MKVLRIHLTHRDAKYSPSDDYTFDVLVDHDERLVDNIPFFGLWGEFGNPENRFPVILLADGKIDRGADCGDDNDRFQKTNIHEKRIVVGEMVTVWEPNAQTGKLVDEYTLRISSVKPLEEEPPRKGRVIVLN